MSGSALRYPSVIERYFTKRFVRGSNNEDLCILEHSNRICLITLASKHPVLAEGLVKKVDYTIDGRNLQTSNNVSGKKKKGAIKTKPRMPICKVTGASGNDYLIRSGVFGKLIEVNENLLKDPTLINKMTDTNGYIAVIQKNHPDFGKQTFGLLTEEEYEKGLPERTTEGKTDKEMKAAEDNSEPGDKCKNLDEQVNESNDDERIREVAGDGQIQTSDDEQPEMKTDDQGIEDNVEPEIKRKKFGDQECENNDYEMKPTEEQNIESKDDEVMKQGNIDELKKEDDQS